MIGGSLGGLFTGTMLRQAGWDVDIYERSPHDLNSRGGGVVLQPEVSEIFHRLGIRDVELGVQSRHRIVYRPDGSVQDKRAAHQTQTSWSVIYRALRGAFDGGYHQGMTLAGIEQDEDAGTATAILADGTRATGDLLVGADGNGSTVRQLLWPEAEPSYAGYFAWRGLVPEAEMPLSAREGLSGAFGFANTRDATGGSHILGYLVPGEDGDVRAGHRLYNWVWYRTADTETLERLMTDRDGRARHVSIPEGQLSDAWVDVMREDARRLLPPPFETVVHATKHPFAQAIRDLTVDTMVKGRVVLLGDAAFIPRPHTAAGTSKAAANAIELSALLGQKPDDIDTALKGWNLAQLWLGNRLYEQGTSVGDYLMFGTASRGARVG